jgi:proteasome lid subunit RPN8/RPN11
VVQIELPPDHQRQLVTALRKAGDREIGGILMAEHVGVERFRVVRLTVQSTGGTFARFVRSVSMFLGPLTMFFGDTQHDYRRFNYLGEWHSHPSFPAVPSAGDISTMREIANDSSVGATFVALLIVKLLPSGVLEGSVTLFSQGHEHERGELVLTEMTS